MSHLTPEAKAKLSSTIRGLRDRLLTDIHNAVESTYRLSLPIAKAGLAEEQQVKRQRLEQWLDEQVRSEVKGKNLDRNAIRDRHLRMAEKLAAATLLNRLVVIKQLEAIGLIKPMIVTGGWQSKGYREFRDFAPDLCRDETEGFGTLLQLLYDELSLEMPGLFGRVRLSSLFPVPASTLRAVIEALNDPALQDAWLDDTTLGWVYQYWNDPERKLLDEKVAAGGKIENHEIASKTQIFTERYMVEWLLQNSLNQQWLAICKKNGWTSDVEASGVLADLEQRRREWREKREAGIVTPEEAMPILTKEEHRWKYWMPPMPSEEFIKEIPESIRYLKILDPAVGSGHFLIIAFDLLTAFYEEEARHLCQDWTPKQIAEWIIENNLHGIDIDPRAVQIAAAALFLKAKAYANDAKPRIVNLVASNFELALLPKNDPAIVSLKQALKNGINLPEQLTETILEAIKEADYLGSLLKIDQAVQDVLQEYRQLAEPRQLLLGEAEVSPLQHIYPDKEAKETIFESLIEFLDRFTSSEDLGLRLKGEQLASGVRFIELVREGKYDLVIANPPYLGADKMIYRKYIEANYRVSKADLYAVFLQRGIELIEFARVRGLVAMITMRGWMFIKDFEDLRKFILPQKTVSRIADLHYGAFPEMKDVSATMSILVNARNTQDELTCFLQPVKNSFIVRDLNQIKRNISGLIAPQEIFAHYLTNFKVIKGQPFIYWWSNDFLKYYAEIPKMEDESEVRTGMSTSNNTRYIRMQWEITVQVSVRVDEPLPPQNDWRYGWVPIVMGAKDQRWIAPHTHVVAWHHHGLTMKVDQEASYGSSSRRIQSQDKYFKPGVAFAAIGSSFSGRAHRYRSIFNQAGSSVFPKKISVITCLLNSKIAKDVMASLNPTVNFEVGDVNRLPLFPIESADEVFAQLNIVFAKHEEARETSVEFKQPGSSCWDYAQQWAQQAVDRESGKPLPNWNPVYDQPPAVNWVSYAIGVALGRFGANGVACFSEGVGILTRSPESALPNGILYLSPYGGDRPDSKDSLNHPAAQPIKDAWSEYGSQIAKNKPLRDWLRLNFFKDVHVGMYEQRPIYFPLSSKNRNFVAYISIHRWADNTLQTLLADYLIPELRELEGETTDLLESQGKGDRKQQAQAEERRATVQTLYNELQAFIDLVQQCAEQGPPAANPKDTPRQTNAPFRIDLDDGVMVNSAALWCLLEPQWNKPKTWWSELCNAKGKKDYDWSHLAARYFCDRVREKCSKDPSLAVAHGCFWQYHPAKAYEWELRLQDEIALDFTIDEENSDALRSQFEADFPQLVADLREKEEKRRDRKRKKEDSDEMPLFDALTDENEEGQNLP